MVRLGYKYLGSYVQKNGGFEETVKKKIKCGSVGGSSGEKCLVFYAIREFKCG